MAHSITNAASTGENGGVRWNNSMFYNELTSYAVRIEEKIIDSVTPQPRTLRNKHPGILLKSNGGYCVYPSNIFHNKRDLLKIREYFREYYLIIPGFQSRDTFRPIACEQEYLMAYNEPFSKMAAENSNNLKLKTYTSTTKNTFTLETLQSFSISGVLSAEKMSVEN